VLDQFRLLPMLEPPNSLRWLAFRNWLLNRYSACSLFEAHIFDWKSKLLPRLVQTGRPSRREKELSVLAAIKDFWKLLEFSGLTLKGIQSAEVVFCYSVLGIQYVLQLITQSRIAFTRISSLLLGVLPVVIALGSR